MYQAWVTVNFWGISSLGFNINFILNVQATSPSFKHLVVGDLELALSNNLISNSIPDIATIYY